MIFLKKGILISLPFILSFQIFSNITDEVVIEEKKLSSLSAWSVNESVDLVDQEALDKLGAQHPKQIFRRIPGVWVSRGSGQEHLTAIRSPVLTGPGACGSFLILENDIPIRPSGFCNVNGLFETFYEEASAIEVIKGPASSRYGANAMHGVINIVPSRIEQENMMSIDIGPNEFFKFKSRISNRKDYSFSALTSSTNGYREESGYEQQKFRFVKKGTLKDWDTSINLTFTNLNQETAGYIYGLNSYKQKELSKKNFNPEAYRDVKSLRGSFKLGRDKGKSSAIISSYVRSNKMDFLQHYLPGTPKEKNSHTSVGVLYKNAVTTSEMEFLQGFQIEMASSKLKQNQADDLTTSSAFNNATRPKGKHYDYQVDSTAIAIFGGFSNINILKKLESFGDIRLESIRYDYDNLMISGNSRQDGSICGFGGCYYNRPNDRTDKHDEISSRFGLALKQKIFNYFVQISLGFRPPQINEAYRLQKKQTVSDLNSEKLVMLETGIKFQSKNLEGSLNLYTGRKQNNIFRDAQNFIIDNGKTKHSGLEIDLKSFLGQKDILKLNLSFGRHKYDFSSSTSMREIIQPNNFVDTAPKFLANVIWEKQLYVNLAYELEIEHISSYFTDAANLHEYEGHTLGFFRLNWDISREATVFFRVDNLLDEEYAERADYNAFGGDRYFPGIPREYYIGVNYSL
tara:strand:- start:72793 stop:74847 length:2055 start_codon:yes stop_codon:yes gene_type:complete